MFFRRFLRFKADERQLREGLTLFGSVAPRLVSDLVLVSGSLAALAALAALVPVWTCSFSRCGVLLRCSLAVLVRSLWFLLWRFGRLVVVAVHLPLYESRPWLTEVTRRGGVA